MALEDFCLLFMMGLIHCEEILGRKCMYAYQKRSPRTQKQKETLNVFIEHFYERHYAAFINEIIRMRLSYYYLHTFLLHKFRS